MDDDLERRITMLESELRELIAAADDLAEASDVARKVFEALARRAIDLERWEPRRVDERGEN